MFGGKFDNLNILKDPLQIFKTSTPGPAAGTGKQYPTPPEQTEQGLKFKIAVIADLDANSKTDGGKFYSYYKTGSLYLKGYNAKNPAASTINVEWDSGEPIVIKSTMNLGGRGMELSELNVYKGQLYTLDDRTGVVFRLLEKTEGELAPIPWVILGDGDGSVSKGMKCEWGAVKGDDFWVGSTGMPNFSEKGEIMNVDTRWVKKISKDGAVHHVDWRESYERLASAIGITAPGYVKHESGGWSDKHKRWVFLPRRACKEAYTTDELMGTNVMLLATENFDNVEVRHVGEVVPSRGFSTFKWIPGTDDQLVVALKTVECGDISETYLLAFDMHGKILVPETKIADQKYEGMKCEWGCVKGDDFWVRSTGNPNCSEKGEIMNVDTRWVKKISKDGAVHNVDSRESYERSANAIGITAPGYVKHESGGWSDKHKRWVFLPRRACKEAYTTDELMGTNVMLLATENFDNVEVRHVGDVVPSRGFSSFKWIPGTDDQLVMALKTVECGDISETYLLAFDMHGKILLPETKIADQKYEGIEFV